MKSRGFIPPGGMIGLAPWRVATLRHATPDDDGGAWL
jgi:hypothetical protein